MAEDCIIPNYLASRRAVLQRQGLVDFTYDAWDEVNIYGPKVVVDDTGLYRMYYTAYGDDGSHSIAMATAPSIEGPWTKPQLGLHTYGADSLNNLVLKAPGVDLQFTDVMIDPDTGIFLMTVRNDTTGTNMLYWSADGELYTWAHTIMTGATGGAFPHPSFHVEIKSLSWHPIDQMYRAWFTDGHPLLRRSIGYYECATLTGTWVNQGYIAEFTSVADTLQYYDFSPFYYAGSLWAVVPVYDQTTEKLGPLRLYRSEDHGDTWTRSTDLLRRVEAPEWDAGLICDGCPVLVDGVWYFYYGGKTGLHDNPLTPILLGLATGVQNGAEANVAKVNGVRVIGNGNTVPWQGA